MNAAGKAVDVSNVEVAFEQVIDAETQFEKAFPRELQASGASGASANSSGAGVEAGDTEDFENA
mgnify:CR=1 FL=1